MEAATKKMPCHGIAQYYFSITSAETNENIFNDLFQRYVF